MVEHCAPHALRIFLHRGFDASHLCNLQGVVQIQPDTNTSNSQVNHEINYLHPKLREKANVMEQPVDSNALLEHISSMLENVPEDEEYRKHYAHMRHLLQSWNL